MKQRLLAILLVLCMVVAFIPAMAVASAAEDTGTTGATNPDVWDGTTFTQPTVGDGTEEKPWELSNSAQFMWFRNKREDDGAGTFYKLTADLDLNHVELGAPTQKTFAGVLDGNNKTIYNVSCAVAGLSPRGLLCISSGTIRNLTLDGVSMNSPSNQGDVTGGLVGQMTGGSIVNCNVLNAELHAKYYVGGLVGKVTGTSTIENCRTSTAEGKSLRTTAAYNTSFAVGGIVGQLDADAATYAAPITLTITGCTNDSRVGGAPTNMANAGGLVGFLTSKYEDKVEGRNKDIENRLKLINCTNNADISSDNADATKACAAGGLIGKTSRFKNILIENCVNRGTVNSASDAAGGFMGRTLDAGSYRNVNLTIKNSVNYGNVTAATSFAGGFFAGSTGFPVTVTVTNSAQCGNVTAGTNAGGIIGNTPAEKGCPITLTGCYVNAQIKAAGETSYAGLLVGSGTKATVTGSGNLLCGTATADTAAGAYLGDGGLATKLTDTYLSGVAGLKLIAHGAAATEATATDADFTGTTVLNALNAAATAAGLPADTWVQGTNNPELKLFYVAPETPEDVSIPIDGASLTIGNSVTLNLFVNKATVDATDVSFTKIYVVSEKGRYEGTLRTEDNKYVFEIKGLTAKEFGENKEYTVQLETADGPVTSTAVKAYSPLQYAINMYGKRTDMATLDPLLLAIVNYADAAGTNAKNVFNTAVFGANIENTETAWGMKLPWYATVLAGDANAEQYTYTGSLPKFGATLSETLTLTATLTGTTYTDLTVKIGNTTVSGEVKDGKVTVSGLYATDLYNTMELIYTTESGTETYTWSLMQYLDSFKGTDDAVLAEATAIYLYAARAFCLANHK